jgi:glycosyltransferase involved in cell wall biosynthesis
MPLEQRQSLALNTFLESNEVQKIQSGHYDFIILNDLDFVGYDPIFDSANISGTPVFVDLHEFFFDFGGSLVFRALNTRYYRWLLNKLESRSVQSFFTVSEAIADLYEKLLPSRPVSVMNVPNYEAAEPEPIGERSEQDKIKLVYHGAAGKGRGVPRLIRAMRLTGQQFELNLVIVGSLFQKVKYLSIALFLGVRKKVHFHRPVEFTQIPAMLKNFDIQVIFYHPPHSTNEKFSLPNKFFESARSGLAVILGDSPSMRKLVEEYDSGWVARGWSHTHLANVINSVSARDLVRKKQNSKQLSREISSDSQRDVFLSTLHTN